MNSTRRRGTEIFFSIVLLALGIATGWWWGQHTSVEGRDTTPDVNRTEPAVLYWYDPMMPQHHFDQPGKSPFMDMELVPRYANEAQAGDVADAGVSIDSQVAQNIGLRAAVVERIALQSVIEASGLLAFNERDVTIEQARSAALVERVWPLAPGDVIAQGQPLAELLVPAWTAAQSEYVAVRAAGETALTRAARERLRSVGLSAAQISELERTGDARQTFILHSTRSGVLQTLDVRSGMTLDVGQTLAQIQGLDTLWLEVAVPESRAGALQVGAEAEARLAAYPGLMLRGKIIAVLPALASGSRTLRVRVEVPNTQGRLRAGMSAQVRLVANAGEEGLVVPTEAVIRTGKRALVMALREQGRYVPVAVTLGAEIDNRTVVSSGLAEGERIVASAQFLLDSEASLGAVPAPVPPSVPGTRVPATPHSGHSAGEQP